MSAERLARFDGLARAAVEEGRLAGVVTLVSRRGRVVQEGVYGLADIADRRPMRPDTIFRIASMTEPLTSVAVMILFEEGRLLLGDPLTRYIPTFKSIPGVLDADGELTPIARPITLLDLLTRSSGRPSSNPDDVAVNGARPPRLERRSGARLRWAMVTRARNNSVRGLNEHFGM